MEREAAISPLLSNTLNIVKYTIKTKPPLIANAPTSIAASPLIAQNPPHMMIIKRHIYVAFVALSVSSI
jgi:hypothetical protein